MSVRASAAIALALHTYIYIYMAGIWHIYYIFMTTIGLAKKSVGFLVKQMMGINAHSHIAKQQRQPSICSGCPNRVS